MLAGTFPIQIYILVYQLLISGYKRFVAHLGIDLQDVMDLTAQLEADFKRRTEALVRRNFLSIIQGTEQLWNFCMRSSHGKKNFT